MIAPDTLRELDLLLSVDPQWIEEHSPSVSMMTWDKAHSIWPNETLILRARVLIGLSNDLKTFKQIKAANFIAS